MMSSQVSIDIDFQKNYQPKEVILALVACGWKPDFEGVVSYLLPTDIDSYDWQFVESSNFDLDAFLELCKGAEKIGISMAYCEEAGGIFLVYSSYLSFSLTINRIYISERLPDFSWYLKRLEGLTDRFQIFKINCECVY